VLIAGAEVAGVAPLDVRIGEGRIAEIAPRITPASDETRIDAHGGALLPGLHDHHLHLFALAAAEESLRCGPPAITDAAALAQALTHAHAASRDGWIRGVGYHESVAGDLDRDRLDTWVRDRPVRIQHRSGALWIVNSAGADRLGLDAGAGADAPGIERGTDGRATGRLFRLDAWLRERVGRAGVPGLAGVSRRLARRGVTGVTDATVGNGLDEWRAFTAACDRGELLQRVTLMGSAELPAAAHPRVERGAVKILLDERDLPPFDDLRDEVAAAHRAQRGVAVHCVGRAELVLACAAIAAVGPRPGDRIEHAGVAPPDTLARLRETGACVVTQPNFIHERGDEYRRDVAARDQPWLYRVAGLLAASIAVGGGSDAPFGDPDPWLAAQAAVDRTTRCGAVLGSDERISPERALALFTTHAQAPGGPPRRVERGTVADLCLLDRPWASAREELGAVRVAVTIRGGEILA